MCHIVGYTRLECCNEGKMSNRPNPNTTAYLFVYFTGTENTETDEQMYFAVSRDGRIWKDLHANGDPILTSTVGERGVRDAYLVRAADRYHFYLIATDLSIYRRGGKWAESQASETGSTSVVSWESDDLVQWSKPRLVNIASRIPDAGMAWAPEALWIEDRQEYMLYWATRSAADNHVGDDTNMYYATTRDFHTFSDPVLWIDREHSVIDTTMIKACDGYYYRVSQDGVLMIERSKNPYAISIGDYIHGNDPDVWTAVCEFAKPLGNSHYIGEYLEGPEFFLYNHTDVQLNATGKPMIYGLMWDQHKTGRGYLSFSSADLSSSNPNDWALNTDIYYGDLKKRHGAILPITQAEYVRICDHYDSDNNIVEAPTCSECR